MLRKLKAAYGSGYRAGRAAPDLIVINGLKYLYPARCPFSPLHFIRYFLWYEGNYKGTIERLSK